MKQINFHNITHDDMLNGDGLRVVLWVAGCIHHCKDCQNPITWDENRGVPLDEWNEAEFWEWLAKPWTKGATFSGGDPLHPANELEVRNLIDEIKEKYPDKTVWLYTGDVWENIYDSPTIKKVDVLVDGEFHIEERDVKLMWKGSKNQRVIDVQATLKSINPIEPVLHCEDYKESKVIQRCANAESC